MSAPQTPGKPSRNQNPSGPDSAAQAAARRPRWQRVLITLGIAAICLTLFMGVALGGAELYTARPEFCGTCHIMDPYYESWSRDIHGRKLGVRCVDCHYAPGERFTIKAKFKGLSQVASYFSGRYGAGRPRAHFDEASCLTSSCHGDGAYREKLLLIGEPRTETRLVGGVETLVERTPSVRFKHAKHEVTPERLAETAQQRAAARQRLSESLRPEVVGRVERVATSVKPTHERQAELVRLFDELELELDEGARLAATALMSAVHLETRLRHLHGLGCAACHAFDATGKRHIAVNQTTCFTCHFNNEGFNTGTGECLKCHEAPTRAIVVHAATTLTPDEKPTLMDHRDIVSRNINCASCHFDVVQPGISVTTRECQNCHDQDRFLAGFEARTTADVERYHEVHIGGRRARCEDCHRGNEHHLLDPLRIEKGPSFLKPVLGDCQHCHPGHHAEQVELLAGIGGAGVDRPMPNAMFGSRINCRACHTEPGSDFKGDPLIKATQDACIACHTSEYGEMFEQWTSEIATYLSEAEALLASAEKRAAELEQAGRPLTRDSQAMLDQARENIRLVKSGRGIHNRHFALQLLDVARRRLTALLGE
jgi:nitrate/TMAO reductase-like tetraheme cytochrome c subunit